MSFAIRMITSPSCEWRGELVRLRARVRGAPSRMAFHGAPPVGSEGGSLLALRRAAVSVLLVHRDQANGRAFASALEDAHLRVSLEADPDAVGPIDAAAFDVVALLLDATPQRAASIARSLRARGYLGAIVAIGVEPPDVPMLLEASVDDFIMAPVHATELVLRIRMALRRVVARARVRCGRIAIDRVHRTAYVRGEALELTAREYALLASLVEAGGAPLSRGELLANVWARDEHPRSNLVEVHLSRLRRKLGGDAVVIETVRGSGYRLRK